MKVEKTIFRKKNSFKRDEKFEKNVSMKFWNENKYPLMPHGTWKKLKWKFDEFFHDRKILEKVRLSEKNGKI